MKNKLCKRLYGALCVLLCAVFIFSFAGCSDPARYEAEKELVTLLRDYDVAYNAYNDYRNIATAYYGDMWVTDTTDIHVKFILTRDESVFLTDEYFTSVSVEYNANSEDYSLVATLDEIGTAIFSYVTTYNIGESTKVVTTYYDRYSKRQHEEIILAPTISAPVTDGIVRIYGFSSKDKANSMLVYFAASSIERCVKNAVSSYNEKCTEYLKQYTTAPDYLPSSLAIEPTYTDVAEYMQKAEAAGFTE